MNAVNSTLLSMMLISLLAFQQGCVMRLRSNSVQGSGVARVQTREVDDFQSINLSGQGQVEVQIGSPQSLEITFDDNLLELVETKVVDGQLTISTRESYNSQLPLLIKITMPSIERAGLSGIGSMTLDGLDGQRLEVRVSGVGQLKASGKVQELLVRLSGTGDADLEELVAESADVTVSGVGNAKIHATQQVNATASGVGGVLIFGNPPEVQSKASGVGTIEMAD